MNFFKPSTVYTNSSLFKLGLLPNFIRFIIYIVNYVFSVMGRKKIHLRIIRICCPAGYVGRGCSHVSSISALCYEDLGGPLS